MRCGAVIVGVLGLVVGVVGLPRAWAQERALPIYRAAKVEVHSDADRETATEVARHMDRAYSAYMQWFKRGARRDAEERARIYLLDTREEYAGLLAKRGINAAGTGGMFFHRGDESAMAGFVNGGSYMQTLRTMQHEGFHQFAYEELATELPRWLDEGLAGYFEHSILTRTRFITGLVPSERAEYLKELSDADGLIPLGELFALTPKDWVSRVASGHTSTRTMYWQSWGVVHFLMHADGGKYEGRFRRLLAGLSDGKSFEDAEQAAFGRRGIGGLESEWRKYAGGGMKPDQLATTADRLEFIAAGIRALHDRDPDRVPDNIDDLGELLRRGGFQLVTYDHAVRLVRRADDPRYFPPEGSPRVYPAPASLRMVSPASKGLPPGVVSEGVRPSLRLEWARDKQGRLREKIVFE